MNDKHGICSALQHMLDKALNKSKSTSTSTLISIVDMIFQKGILEVIPALHLIGLTNTNGLRIVLN
jgi:hypothetical protein